MNINGYGSVTVPSGEHWLVTGTYETKSNAITLQDGATVTLSNVVINCEDYNLGSCIRCNGDATIILDNGTESRLYGGLKASAIGAGPRGKTLTIRGNGTLFAEGGYSGAGIGYRSDADNCSDIVIEGGNIGKAACHQH